MTALRLRPIPWTHCAPWLLAAAVGAAYANSLSGVFVFDDLPAIVNNVTIRRLWPPWPLFATALQTATAGRPLLTLTFALNFAVSRLDPAGYHLTNLAIHLASALFLYGALRRTLAGPRCADAVRRAAAPLGLAAALLWAVHPLHTESVTYVVQRAESLAGCLSLAALYALLRGAAAPRPRIWYAAAVLACGLGMATKESVAVLPLILLAYDRIFLVRSWRALWRARAPLYAGVAATWLVLAALIAQGPRTQTVGFGLPNLPWWVYLAAQGGVIAHYLRLLRIA